jgi:hypothetical protein
MSASGQKATAVLMVFAALIGLVPLPIIAGFRLV